MDAPGEPADIRLAAWNALKGASWTMLRRIHDEMHGEGEVTHAQRAFLHVLSREPEPPTAQEVARRLDVTPATITGMVNKLEDAGCVQRLRADDDRRVVRIRVTPKGHKIVREWRARFHHHLAEFMSPLSDKELRALVKLLHKLGPPIEGPPGGFGALIRHDVGGAKHKKKL